MVSARTDCADDFVWLSGGKNELDVGRWFFNDFEQCVEALRRNHVGLVEDEDLETVSGRGKDGAFTEVSGVVNTVV